MKRRIFSIIATLLFVSLSAFAQKRTVYGEKYSRDLRFTSVTSVHTEVMLGGHYSDYGGITSYGGDLQATRVYTPSNAFAWRWGASISSDYSDDYGMLVDACGVLGIRVGNAVSFGIDALAGAGQMPFLTCSTNGVSTHDGYLNIWRPTVQGQVSLAVRLSPVVSLTAFGRYGYYFNSESDYSLNVAEGWTSEPTEWFTTKWLAGAALSFNLNRDARLSGDSCWNMATYGGYSFKGNEGWVAGAELYHYKRWNYTLGQVLGFGSEQVLAEKSANSVYAKAGIQISPKGADSPVLFEFGVKVGVGEYVKAAQGETDGETFKMRASWMSPAFVTKGYAGVHFHVGRVTLRLAAEGGYHDCFGADFGGSNNYSGEASQGEQFDLATTAGICFAF